MSNNFNESDSLRNLNNENNNQNNNMNNNDVQLNQNENSNNNNSERSSNLVINNNNNSNNQTNNNNIQNNNNNSQNNYNPFSNNNYPRYNNYNFQRNDFMHYGGQQNNYNYQRNNYNPQQINNNYNQPFFQPPIFNYQNQNMNLQQPGNNLDNRIIYDQINNIYTDQSDIYSGMEQNYIYRAGIYSTGQIPQPIIPLVPPSSHIQNNINIPHFIPPAIPSQRNNLFGQNNNRLFPRFIPPIRIGPSIIQNNKELINQLEEVKMTDKMINKNKVKECCICLEEFIVGDIICYLPCFHFFHSICIKKWIEKSNKCPLCNIVIKFE